VGTNLDVDDGRARLQVQHTPTTEGVCSGKECMKWVKGINCIKGAQGGSGKQKVSTCMMKR